MRGRDDWIEIINRAEACISVFPRLLTGCDENMRCEGEWLKRKAETAAGE